MEIAVISPGAEAVYWFYAITSLARVLAYVPQLRLLWRCADGARSISMLTWLSTTAANVAATVYAMLVAGDAGLTLVAASNMIGSGAIVWLAAQRRGITRTRSVVPACR